MSPMKSEAQRRLMYAAAAGKSTKVKPAVAKKFIRDSAPPKKKGE